MARRTLGVCLIVGAVVAVLAGPPVAASPSLPAPSSGHRPGPDILYAPLAVAPQLTNAGIWAAAPILVSGASAYRSGEYVYQDFIYDDHGAAGNVADTHDPRRSPGGQGTSGDLFSMPGGTYTYPTDAAKYANNAADLVELRVKPIAGATAFRVTLNTLVDPSLVGFSLALGTGPAKAVPHGANATAAAAHVVTVHGATADLDGAAPAAPIGVAVDMRRRQVEVRVPLTDWQPGTTEHISFGVGLWDAAGDRYLVPGMNATATTPGGAGTLSNPAAFFNVAFRHDEPMPYSGDVVGTATAAKWWRDQGQAQALAAGDLTHYGDVVDFAKLAARVDDDMHGLPQGVPTSGPMDRILASHFETEQGADYSQACASATSCQGELRGRLQPYAIYVPAAPPPARGYGLTLLLHSLSANYNQYLSTRNQSQFANRTGASSIVITPEGRGSDGWYYDVAGADTFEVWADVAARFPLDSDLTDVTGYSMGGYGTYKFATQFPDLFARAQPTVGPPALGIWIPPLAPTSGQSTNTNAMLASVRNIPFVIWVAVTDELVPFPGTEQQARTFDALGYRYVFDTFQPAEHLTLAINDQFQPAADLLGRARVDRNPAHVTYVVNPSMDFAQDGTRADHAYWLSDLHLRNAAANSGLGTIDVRSEGFGTGDPAPSGTQVGAGALTGGNLPALLFEQQSQTWGAVPTTPVADRLDIEATNVSRVVVDVERAHVDCAASLKVTSDGPLDVVLAGCGRGVTVAAGRPGVGGASGAGFRIPNTSSSAASTVVPAVAVLVLVLVPMRRRTRR